VLGAAAFFLSSFIFTPSPVVMGGFEAYAYFLLILLSACVISGGGYVIWRYWNNGEKSFLLKLTIGSLIATIVSALVGGLFLPHWFHILEQAHDYNRHISLLLLIAMAGAIYNMMQEAILLHYEKQDQLKIANDLNRDRIQAETAILRNELDPHFIFNALASLNYLVRTEHSKAAIYSENLSQVYKYILLNKNSTSISLQKELDFINEYVSLQSLVHEGKIQVTINSDLISAEDYLTVPCVLQILIENAIKHNEFNKENPLVIRINIKENILIVVNNLRLKKMILNSTETGLKNLKQRYSLISDEEIIVNKTKDKFIVLVPLVPLTKYQSHDQHYHHRRPTNSS
jgi:sensor histidine kinase YesM